MNIDCLGNRIRELSQLACKADEVEGSILIEDDEQRAVAHPKPPDTEVSGDQH